MGSFFKKDVLLLWRDRKEILIGLILPIVLIAVLGFALPDWIENTSEPLDLQVALVIEDDAEAGVRQFKELLASADLAASTIRDIEQQADQVSPMQHLERMFEDEQVMRIMNVETMDEAAAIELLQQGELTAVITVPDGFTSAALQKLLLNRGEGASLSITAIEANLQVDIIHGIIDEFVQTFNFQTALHHSLGENAPSSESEFKTASLGGRELVSGVHPITSFQYYALAISILFALFIAVTTADKAIVEKREQVFQRLLLSGAHPTRYLLGKATSSFCLAYLQMVVVLLASHGILQIFSGRSVSFWCGIALVLFFMALSVAALSAFFTAFIFRFHEQSANSITMLFVLITGTIGGSFVPMYILPEWLKDIGLWTPNGLTLVALIQWVQEESFAILTLPLLKLSLFAIIVLAAGMMIFPRRGRI